MSNADLFAFEKKFRQQELRVAELENWSLSVRPGQLTLGAMILASKTGATSMASLPMSELREMGAGLALAERLAIRTFQAGRINFLCLMMQDPIVHFHVFPRYPEPVNRFGVDWHDRDWPGPPNIVPVETADDVLLQIRNALGESL